MLILPSLLHEAVALPWPVHGLGTPVFPLDALPWGNICKICHKYWVSLDVPSSYFPGLNHTQPHWHKLGVPALSDTAALILYPWASGLQDQGGEWSAFRVPGHHPFSTLSFSLPSQTSHPKLSGPSTPQQQMFIRMLAPTSLLAGHCD